MNVVESLTDWILGNSFLRGVIGIGMANVVCQLNFAYLDAVFFLQLGLPWLSSACCTV